MPRFRSRKPAEQPAYAPRSGSTVKRDVYRATTAGLTGVTAFGALAVTGAVAGTAAHDKAVSDAGKQQVAPPSAPAAQVVTKRRKHRTVVRTRVVHATVATGVARVSTGGTVSRPSSGGSQASSGGAGHPAPKPAASRPPAPPAPPAPSSGS